MRPLAAARNIVVVAVVGLVGVGGEWMGEGFITPIARMPAAGRGPRAAPAAIRMRRGHPADPVVADNDGRGRGLRFERDARGRLRLAFREDGWSSWTFNSDGGQSFAVNYVQHGQKGTPCVLVHGFGASAYHWRYQLAELGKSHRVYALCLLGHGHSEKGHLDFSRELLGEQVNKFINEVVGEPSVVVGNSLGGIVGLQAAASKPHSVRGLVLMNVPGNFAHAARIVNLKKLKLAGTSAARPFRYACATTEDDAKPESCSTL